jgi:two-component system, LytTR family, response regulator
MKIKVLIIDDEKLARQELHHQLKDYANIEIVGEAENADEGIEKIETLQPDLIFLDVSMPAKSAFDMLEQLDEVPSVIFVTAYDKYALKAFEANALDYILKPIRPERLQQAVEKALEEIESKRNKLSGALTPNSQVFIKDGEKCFFVKVSDIFLLESAGNYVKVFFEKKFPLLHKSLNLLEEKLPPDMFFRANRQQMFNLNYIQNIESYFKGGLHVTLKSGHTVEVSTRQAVRFKELMSL